MRGEFVLQPGRLLATLVIALVLLLVSGYVGTASALRTKAAPVLRQE
jgi:predicted lysophospholipase L1 biosynthesis ABC-type transport system permease subunit